MEPFLGRKRFYFPCYTEADGTIWPSNPRTTQSLLAQRLMCILYKWLVWFRMTRLKHWVHWKSSLHLYIIVLHTCDRCTCCENCDYKHWTSRGTCLTHCLWEGDSVCVSRRDIISALLEIYPAPLWDCLLSRLQSCGCWGDEVCTPEAFFKCRKRSHEANDQNQSSVPDLETRLTLPALVFWSQCGQCTAITLESTRKHRCSWDAQLSLAASVWSAASAVGTRGFPKPSEGANAKPWVIRWARD